MPSRRRTVKAERINANGRIIEKAKIHVTVVSDTVFLEITTPKGWKSYALTPENWDRLTEVEAPISQQQAS
jgi:hypothetical protein